MFIAIIGTRAQLIKMAPVLLHMEDTGLPFRFLLTGQHRETIPEILAEFKIKTRPDYLYEGSEVNSIAQVPLWFYRCIHRFKGIKGQFHHEKNLEQKIVLVHGDTFSTLLGAVLARLIGAKVAHVEAGLRSFNFFHPFPEEITRILTFYLSDISFCPGRFAYDNMSKYGTERIDTHLNTLIDSTKLVLTNHDINTDAYVVCSIHRFENIFFRKKLQDIVELMKVISNHHKIIFVLHPATRRNLEKFGLYKKLLDNPSIEVRPRMSYSEFIKLLSGASFVVSDGGSNQEELYYMGIPTLLFRKRTERNEGLTETAVLSNLDKSCILDFLENYRNYRKPGIISSEFTSPSSIITDHLKDLSLPSL